MRKQNKRETRKKYTHDKNKRANVEKKEKNSNQNFCAMFQNGIIRTACLIPPMNQLFGYIWFL